MIVVADATVLIVLARIGWLPVLRDLFGSVVVPAAVRAEVFHPEHVRSIEARTIDAAIAEGWLDVQDRTDDDNRAPTSLGAGERSVISLGLTEDATLLLLDDLDARLSRLDSRSRAPSVCWRWRAENT